MKEDPIVIDPAAHARVDLARKEPAEGEYEPDDDRLDLNLRRIVAPVRDRPRRQTDPKVNAISLAARRNETRYIANEIDSQTGTAEERVR